MTTRRILLLLAAPPVLFVALAAAAFTWVHIPEPEPLSVSDREAVHQFLRSALEGRAARSLTSERFRRAQDEPVIATLWRSGIEVARFQGQGDTLAAALSDVAAHIRRSPPGIKAAPEHVRIKLDVITSRGPLVELHPLISAVALHPGVDGLGARIDGHGEAFLLPDDLILGNMLQAGAPIKHVDFKLGVNYRRALSLAARRLQIKRKVAEAGHRDWFRFRTLSLVESAGHERLIALRRGTPERPAFSRQALREAAIAGGRYLVSHLAANGRYEYQVDLASGRSTNPNRPGPYSIPRHAGTTYFLAELYRLTGEEFLREPIERAFRHLQELIEAGGCTGKVPGSGAEFACVIDRGQRSTELGSTALTVVALAEYQRATGKDTYLPLARKLAEFLLWMQREDGSFTHVYRVTEKTRDESAYL
ncbi:MAG: hypothetical protein KJO07_02845, partial [Deltaproteobacteria bacterium]|nr:hypothetical protein [Deltaproteobacteria bacterium]